MSIFDNIKIKNFLLLKSLVLSRHFSTSFHVPRLLSLVLICLWLFGIAGFAQQGKIEFTEFDLTNGLHVILHQNNSVPIISIRVVYHVGSKNETSDRTGFAHFFEHLMFEGSDNIKRGEYSKIIQNAGGNENASTSFDITEYHESLPSNQLELGLWLESERMMHLKIDSIGIETQRLVVKEEKKQRFENTPYGRCIIEIMRNSFKVHPYQWMPIGEDQYIDEAGYSEFMDFYKKYYVPENAVLVIAGDFMQEQAKALIKKYFDDIPKGKFDISRPVIKEPAQESEVRKTVFDKVQLPAIFYAYHTPASGTSDSYAMVLLQKWLTGGESSQFFKSLVDQQQLAMQVGAIPLNLEDPGLFIIYSISNIGVTAADMDKAMNIEIEEAKTKGLNEHDFQKIKNQIETDFYSSNSTMEGIAASLAEYFTYFKNTNLINTEIEKYNSITREDLLRVAKKYLMPENRLVLYYLPDEK